MPTRKKPSIAKDEPAANPTVPATPELRRVAARDAADTLDLLDRPGPTRMELADALIVLVAAIVSYDLRLDTSYPPVVNYLTSTGNYPTLTYQGSPSVIEGRFGPLHQPEFAKLVEVALRARASFPEVAPGRSINSSILPGLAAAKKGA